LSNANLKSKPWYLFDYKLDEHLARIQHAQNLGVHERLPTKPGLYHIKPELKADDDNVELMLRKIWRRGDSGIYFDEGYSVPQGPWKNSFRTLMTQGRSLNIGVITLTQRPVWIDRFAISEADFYAVFHLNQKSDRKTVEELLPDDYGSPFETRLPDYHCRWYDVGRDWLCELSPAPSPEISIAKIDSKLKPKKRWI